MESITNKQVYDIYTNQTGSVDKKASSTYYSLLELHAEHNEWVYSEKIFNRVKKIKELVTKRQGMRKMSPDAISSWESEIFVELRQIDQQQQHVPDDEVEVETTTHVDERSDGRGRPKKRLSEQPTERTSHKILDGVLNYLNTVAGEQNITTDSLLRALSERWAQRNGKCREETPNMDELSACSIIYNINLSLGQYQELRMELLPHGFALPIRNEVDKFKKTLLPSLIVSESVKSSCDLQELVCQTVSSLLEIKEVTPTSDIKVVAKFGLDGSGSHKIRHQNVEMEDGSDDDSEEDEEEDEETTSYLGGFWCPLLISCRDITLWSNPLPNSILYARPLCLVREKETRESVQDHFKPYMDKLVEFENTPIPISNDSSAKVVTEISMVDGKMVDLIQGDSGSFCHYCYTTREDANNIEKIMNGFTIEKTAEKCFEKWQSLESGEMRYDDSNRGGQVHKPLNTRSIRFYGITHQKLRSLDHMEKLLYHLVSGQTHTWSEREYRVKDALKSAKKETIKHIRKKLGFLIDTPTSGGGNTDTGGIAERFFSRESREDICSIILKESDRVAFSKLLELYNTVLSVCQNTDASKKAIPQEVRGLCQELMLFEKTKFPWAMLSPSVHSMCGHNPELFIITQGAPIAIYSEQGSEAWNKHIRSYKSGPAARARQTSVQENILDIFNRMMVRTHPKIASRKRQLECTRCKKLGHTIRSCPEIVVTVLDAEATRVQSCFE